LEVDRDINSIYEPEENGLVLNDFPFVECESFHDVDGDNVDEPNHVDFSLNDVNNRDLTLSESDPEPNEDFDYIDDSLIAIEIKEQPPHSLKDQLTSWAVIVVGFPVYILTNYYLFKNPIRAIPISLLMPAHC
jgi:hypothetical protein